MAKENLYPRSEVDPSTFHIPVERGSPEWRTQRIQRAYCTSENYRRRDLAIHLADMCGANLAQIAMLYPLTRGRHISVIFGSSKANHLDDMVALQHMIIDEEAMSLLAGTQLEHQKGIFAFISQLLGLGNNNVIPMSLTSKGANRVNGEASESSADSAAKVMAGGVKEPAFIAKRVL